MNEERKSDWPWGSPRTRRTTNWVPSSPYVHPTGGDAIYSLSSLETRAPKKGTEPDSKTLGGLESLTPSRSAPGRPQAARHDPTTVDPLREMR